jgi:hypothetical protein
VPRSSTKAMKPRTIPPELDTSSRNVARPGVLGQSPTPDLTLRVDAVAGEYVAHVVEHDPLRNATDFTREVKVVRARVLKRCSPSESGEHGSSAWYLAASSRFCRLGLKSPALDVARGFARNRTGVARFRRAQIAKTAAATELGPP